ncbi:hypothetical protein E2C01_060366 [Portunus trituberculatus]|uniref:Pro-corazonin n=1 Tax=Portunus trituberculatus TaxID=210409 RepID=A0A5B7H8N6_PORTR|nr:hypothetical protein [Portunus trituberculatus]
MKVVVTLLVVAVVVQLYRNSYSTWPDKGKRGTRRRGSIKSEIEEGPELAATLRDAPAASHHCRGSVRPELPLCKGVLAAPPEHHVSAHRHKHELLPIFAE